METKMWLVRAASLAVVGTLTVAAAGQKPPKKKQKGAPAPAAAAPAEPQKPPASTTPEKEEEGPFAPKGRTGKLKEEMAPEGEEQKPEKEKAPPPPAPERPGAAGADIVFGFGKTGGTTGPDAVELSVVSFILGAKYNFTPEVGARLRVPFATGKITHVGNEASTFERLGEGYNAAAFGNIELAGNYTLSLSPSAKLPLELAFAVPTAGGDRFPPSDDNARGRHYRINAAAAASRGLEEDALFAPHRLGIIPKASIRYTSGSIDTDGFVKVPILIKTGGENVPPPPTGNTASFALNPTVIMGVIGGGFHYGFVDNKIDVGSRAWFSFVSNDYYDIIYTGGTVTQPSKFQFVLEPQVRAHVGAIQAVLGFIWPLGGKLGGDQQVNGVRLSGTFVF
jgi:hypothetical protein